MAEKKPKTKTRSGPPSRPPLTLTTAWAAVVLGLLVVVFFHPVVFESKTFVSPDTVAPAGFVRQGEISLNRDHVYPLWNPYVFLGMPSFASGAYNPLIYPPDWPLAVLQKILPLPDLTWMLLYYFLAGLFTFLLAREWGATAQGALLGAVAFVFAPNLIAVGSHGHGSQLVDSAYLPLMLWLAARWMRQGGLAHLGWLALAAGFQMLRGHAQIAFYTWLALGLYLMVDVAVSLMRPAAGSAPASAPAGTKLVRAAGVLAALALGFGLAGFYNLPLHDYARWSIRGGGEGGGVGMSYATQWSMSPRELPTVVIPGAVGFGDATYWGGMPFTNYPNAFMGMVVVLLSLPAWFAGGAPRWFAVLLALVSLGISFGSNSPLYGFLYKHLPYFNKFRVPVMIILLFQLALALGAAWGWSAVSAARTGAPEKRGPGGRLWLAAAVFLGLVLIIGVGGQDAWREGYVRTAMAHREGYSREAGLAAYGRYVADLGRACVLGLLAVGAIVMARGGRLAIPFATAGLLVLMLFELWPVSASVMNPVIGERQAATLETGRDDVVDFLEHAGPPGSFRILPLDEFQTNRYAGFAVASVGGAHAAKTRLIQDFIESGYFQGSIPWLRLLNVRFLVTHRAEAIPGLPPVHQGSGTVYEMPDWLPRATVVGEYRVVTPAIAILDSVAGGHTDEARVTYLERDPHLTLGPVEGARAEITSYRLNDVTVQVETPGPALLRLADLWFPDWEATVDGKPAEILKADYLLRAVPVPSGAHRVEFHYRPGAMRRGLWLSFASATVALGLLAVGLVRGRRSPHPVPEGA